MTTIHLDGRDILPCLRGDYRGNKFQVRVCESVEIPADAGLWEGGSRSVYYGVNLMTGHRSGLTFSSVSPWNAERRNVTVTLEQGKAVVRHSMFRGVDMGLQIFLHPDNATKLLPVKVELGELDQMVINATARYKASYGGKDRFEMATGYDRSMGRPVPTRDQWDRAKARLIAAGLLDKRGALTIKGKNAVTR